MAFSASYKGIGEMLTAEWMQAAMLARAEAGKAYAEGIAPRRTGKYAGSFEASAGVRDGARRRAYGRLANTDSKALHLEFGTEDTPAHRTLGKALDIMGS